MVLISHILIALLSVITSSLTWLVPSVFKLRLSQTLIALTLVSGTYLVVSTHSNMVSACMSGLMYLSLVSVLLLFANHKLSSEKSDI
jgi:hypothetical protein